MSKRYKVGIIGVGGIASTHFDGWRESPHTELVALADVSEETVRRVGRESEVARLYTDPQELIASHDIDIVDICTPNMYHAPLAIAALEAGKHVYCEKPLAPTPGEIRRIIDARDKAGKLVMTAQQMRWGGPSKALKTEIEHGALGKIYHARAWMLRRTLLPLWSKGFIRKAHSGGGPTIDVGVHMLDLALWLMGHPKPVAVVGTARREVSKVPGAFSDWGGLVPEDMDVEDFAGAWVRFADGSNLILEVSWLMHHPSNEQQLWLYGDHGGATWPNAKLFTSNNERQQRYDIDLTRLEKPKNDRAEAVKAFAEAVAEGKPSPVPPEQSLAVQSILHGIYRSSELGREVVLEEEEDLKPPATSGA